MRITSSHPLRLLPVVFLAAAVSDVRAQDPVPPNLGFAVTTAFNQIVVYEDGYQTAVDVQYPTVGPPVTGWPVLVLVHGISGSRTGYQAGEGQSYAKAGYLTVAYDVRGQGTYRSAPVNAGKGTTIMGLRERRDLKLMIQWVLTQYPALADPARVGVRGSSQGGAHAWFAAAWSGQVCDASDPAVGLFPTIAAVSADNFNPDYAETLAPLGMAGGVAVLGPSIGNSYTIIEPSYLALVQGSVDSENWAALHNDADNPLRNTQDRIASLPTAVLFASAWDDHVFIPNAAAGAMTTIPASTPWSLYLGTNGHNSPSNTEENALRGALARSWLDRHLKGTPTEAGDAARVQWVVEPYTHAQLNSSSSLWTRRSAQVWPPPGVATQRWHLTDAATLTAAAPAVAMGARTLTQPAASPSYTAMNARLNGMAPAAILGHYPLHEVTYQSDVLLAPIEICGAFTAQIQVASTSPAWQVTVALGATGAGETWRYISSGTVTERGAGAAIVGPRTVTGHLASVIVPAGARLQVRLRSVSVHHDDPTTGATDLRLLPVFAPWTASILHGSATQSYIDVPVMGAPQGSALLTETRSAVSVVQGCSVVYAVHGGLAGLGTTAYLGLSASGDVPGTLIAPFMLPLNVDAFTTYVLANPDVAPLSGFVGPLSATAQRTATVALPAALMSPAWVGLHVTCAGVLVNALGVVTAVTNPVGVVFQP